MSKDIELGETGNTSGRLLPKNELVELACALVGPMEKGAVSYIRAAVGAMALMENGIEADLIEREAVFDPERWTRPTFLYALRIKRLRGHIFGGSDDRTWDGVARLAREQNNDAGDYLDMGKPRKVDLKSFLTMNQDRPEIQATIARLLEQARSQVGEWLLKHNVDQPHPSTRRGGPRL